MTNTPSCTCKDWIQFRIPCKHFFAIFDHAEQWKWESLPKHYLESPHITADVRAFDNQYPTVSDTTPNKPLDLVCSSDDPPIPNTSDSADTDIMPVRGQDPVTQEDSNVRNTAVPHSQVFTDGFHNTHCNTGWKGIKQLFFLKTKLSLIVPFTTLSTFYHDYFAVNLILNGQLAHKGLSNALFS